MSVEDDAKLLHDHLELMHRLNQALVDALLDVAKQSGKTPYELAQLVGFGGGGFHALFQPLMMRYQEEQQRRILEVQQRAQQPPEVG